MNERIEELWDMAAEDTMDDSWQSQTKFMERFAELIVRECCDKFVDMQHKFHPSICAYEIKKHFGVNDE